MVASRVFSLWAKLRLRSSALSFISFLFILALLASGTLASATTVATPTFNPAAGTYTATQSVTISDTTAGASIYYTTNGTTPTTASTLYSSAITVSETETLKALGTHSGDTNSSVGSAKYTIKVATPTLSPGAGTYTATQTVTISDTIAGASIYYTTNGTTPTTASTLYSGAVTVSATQSLKALATATGDTNSAVGSAKYTIDVATPTFSPGAGTYTSAQTVTISDTTAGANIYYTTNGGTPTTASTHYSSAITVSATGTLKAIATETGDTNSAVGSAVYTINLTTATPTFSPAAGTYGSAQTVTLSDTTAGSNIYYTTNGTTPTTASTHYSAAITVSATETLEAIAAATGYANSSVASAVYTISIASIHTVQDNSGYTANGLSVPVAFGSNVSAGDVVVVAESTYDGETQSIPTDTQGNSFTLAVSDGVAGSAVAAIYVATARSTSADTVTCAISTGTGDNIHCHIYEVSGVTTTVDKSGSSSMAGTALTVSTSAPTANANDYVFAYFADNHSGATYTVGSGYGDTQSSIDSGGGDSGFSEDLVVSATGTQTATATASNTDTFVNVIVTLEAGSGLPVVSAPTFSPAAGTYGPTQTVTISDATAGATIYYTTNGTTPTTASSMYSSAITVSANETLEAIGAEASYTNSAVSSAAYVITGIVNTPTFSPVAGNYLTAQTVTISDAVPGANIYYTTNGTTPTTASTHYSSAITVSATQTLEALATDTGLTNSAVATAVYTIGMSGTPIKTVQHNSESTGSGTSQTVSYTSNVTAGNVLLVAESTYDGESLDTPTDTLGNSFTQVVTGSGGAGASVAAIYVATANSSGADTVTCHISAANNIHCHIYEVQGITTTVDQTGTATVTSTAQSVSTSAATTNANDFIFAFFADNDEALLTSGPGQGDTDTSNDGGDNAMTDDKVVVATGVQTATATSSVSATDEDVIVALKTTGTPTVSTPTFSPAPGTYIYAQTVTISDWTAGSSIYYTTNGTTPTTSSTLYTGPITVSITQTVEALAIATGFANSSVASVVYTITPPAGTPGFSPAAGSYASAQTVTITDSTAGATIYYTTNGYTPTTNSTAYSSPISVSVWETLQAVAIAPGYSESSVGVGTYTIGNGNAAAPAFSPGPGDYVSTQTVTLSDSTAGASIYYTTNGTTPTTASTYYTSAISVSATETIEAIATASGYSPSGVASGVYTINGATAECDDMSVGSSVAGTADMNGFVPFQSATTGVVNQWNTNIAGAAVDPNNAAIQTTGGFSGLNTHVNFGSSPGDGGIPFMVVDSGSTPSVPIYVVGGQQSDVVVAPYPSNVPIEGNAADCSGWPNTYQSDSHTNVLDRNGCWDYETFNTNRCDGLYSASGEVIWDMQNGEYRPWGWTSTDAAGLSVMAGLLKYDEAASGTIKHAIRYTMQQSKQDANDGYFVEPASHAAGTLYGAPVVEGMRIRLNPTFNISGYSAINQTILTAFQQYGLIMADNGGYLYIQGATDSRWDNSDLENLAGIPSSDFTVVQMSPSYPGWDSVTAPTGAQPVISSFTVSNQTVSAGTPVTFNFSVSGDSYDYIDMIGPVRLTSGSGSVTVYPTATQTYTLYSVNQYGNNGSGVGYGVTASTPITVVVPGSTVAAPTFTPAAGTYSAATAVTFNTTSYPWATFYYTTDGTTPTYPPTGTTIEYPVIPQPQSPADTGTLSDITVSATSTIKAIAVAPGYSSPSAVSTAAYTIN